MSDHDTLAPLHESGMNLKLYWLHYISQHWDIVEERSEWNVVTYSFQRAVLKHVKDSLRMAEIMLWSAPLWSKCVEANSCPVVTSEMVPIRPELWMPPYDIVPSENDQDWLGLGDEYALAAKLIMPLLFPDPNEGTVMSNGKRCLEAAVEVRFYMNNAVVDEDSLPDVRECAPVLRTMPCYYVGRQNVASHQVLREQACFLSARHSGDVKRLSAKAAVPEHYRDIAKKAFMRFSTIE